MAKARKKQVIPDTMSFQIVVYPNPDESGFIAHSVVLDVVGFDYSVEGAISELLEAIETQVEVCQRTSAQFIFPAPANIWRRYRQAQLSGRKISDELMDRIVRNANRRLGSIENRIDQVITTHQVPREQCLLVNA